MENSEKKALAMTGDMSKQACARRLHAALISTGMSQSDIAHRIMRKPSSITNQVKGDQFPARELMVYLYEEHRIDFNFIMAGAFNHLPVDVAEKLFPALVAAKQS